VIDDNDDDVCLDNISIETLPEQCRVNINFNEPRISLEGILDWMFNSGDFMTMSMADDVIKKAEKAGLKITKVVDEGSNEIL
jgi:hypothetical protein